MTEHITPIMQPDEWTIAADTDGDIWFGHKQCDREYPVTYPATGNSWHGEVPFDELLKQMQAHKNGHHADGVYCVNATCSRHYGGLAGIHQDTQ